MSGEQTSDVQITAERAELDQLLTRLYPGLWMTAADIGQLCEHLSTEHFEVFARIDSLGGHVAVFLHRELRGSVPDFLRRPAHRSLAPAVPRPQLAVDPTDPDRSIQRFEKLHRLWRARERRGLSVIEADPRRQA